MDVHGTGRRSFISKEGIAVETIVGGVAIYVMLLIIISCIRQAITISNLRLFAKLLLWELEKRGVDIDALEKLNRQQVMGHLSQRTEE
jgi:hypothetical protein